MMEKERRCYGCMKEKTQSVCEHCGWDEKRNNAPHQLPVGTILRDQYVIGRALGQGGFGITYLGWDRYLDIPVAIKEYYPTGIVSRESSVSTVVCCYDGEIGDRFQKSKERFMRESKTLARFSGMPEVVQVKSFFLANNTAYIVMEYVQGITMKEYVRRAGGRLTMERTLEMLRPVIQSLEKLHREGVVHRDISPDNIMILPNGRMKLIDFGAVRDVSHADVDIPLSRSTEAILKQGFAPIEQYQNRGSLGPWTDVYAMCATIYYCVTGHVLLDAPGRLLDSPELNLRQTVAMTAGQEQALNHGLELLPAKRTRSMAELEHGLYMVASGDTVPLDDGKTIPLDDGKTIPLDDNRTIPLDPNRPIPKWDETKPIEDVVEKPKPKPQPEKKTAKLKPIYAIACAVALCVLLFWTLHPHKYGEWEIVVDATCETDGSQERRCFCGDKQTAVISKTGHVEVVDYGYEASLTSSGLSDGAHCSVCGKVLIQQKPIEQTVFMMAAQSEHLYDNERFWGTLYLNSSVKTVSFRDTKADAPADAHDVSAAGDRSVLCWMEGSKLIVAANGKIAPNTDASYLFCNFDNLERIDFNDSFDTSHVTDMSEMFCCCAKLDKLDLSCFDTSNVTNMSYMFQYCQLDELDVSSFDTSNVQNMEGMFQHVYVTDLDLSNFDTSKVTNMAKMFNLCRTRKLDLSDFDTSNVTTMAEMFSYCYVSEFDISGFDTSSVTNMREMFSNFMNDPYFLYNQQGHFDKSCLEKTSVTSLDLSFFDTSKVKTMASMFFQCNLRSFNLSSFDTSSVTDMYAMFEWCQGITKLDLSNFDTSKVTDMARMFLCCKNLKTLDISGFSASSIPKSGGLIKIPVFGKSDRYGSGLEGMFDGSGKLVGLKCTDERILKVYENKSN